MAEEPLTNSSNAFTSHYVTINSQLVALGNAIINTFTSHYVTINSITAVILYMLIIHDLHPTM